MNFMSGKLLGSYKMKLNRENLTVPRDFARIIRTCPTPECFVTISQKRLMIFPMGSWQQYTAYLGSLKTVSAKRLLHKQLMFGSKPAKIDSSGRLTLSSTHYAFLQEPQEVMFSGQGEYLEVWNVEEYTRIFEKLSEDYDLVAPEDLEDGSR